MNETGSVKTWLLAFVVAAASGFGLLIAAGCAIGANECPFGDDDPVPEAVTGQELYQRNCIACHGPEGRGIRGAGPSLVTGPPARYSLEQLMEKISRGRPFMGMPRFENEFTAEQLRDVATYVMSLREGS